VGDNDGYGGQGIADNGNMPTFLTGWDFRSVGEKAATNGAEHTDAFGAFGNFSGSPLSSVFDVLFPFAGALTDGSLTIDMASFQSQLFGDVSVTINGFAQPGMLFYAGNPNETTVRTFALSAAVINAANLAGQVVLHLDRGTSVDEVAFDYFRLDANTQATTTTTTTGVTTTAGVPEPSMVGLLALAGAWVATRGLRRRRGMAQSSR
jgi:hypothetical protein